MLAVGSLAGACTLVTASTADSAALAAVGGGHVVSTQVDRAKNGTPYFDVKISNANGVWDVYVNGCTGAVISVHKDA
jgi:uncharacterized membrane protein YkoI